MKLLVEPTPNYRNWDAEALKLGGTLFHTRAWSRHRCHDGLGRPLFFRWYTKDPAEPAALALGIQRPRPGSHQSILGTRLAFDSAPATLTSDIDFVESLTQWSKNFRSIAEIYFGSFDARSDWSRHPLPN